MCLGIPGKIVSIVPNSMGLTMGRVDLGGVLREVCLAYTPDALPGDYVIVHAGFAISMLDQDEATATLSALAQLEQVADDELSASLSG
jgi:hydrogenase expression/formation protein HypC